GLSSWPACCWDSDSPRCPCGLKSLTRSRLAWGGARRTVSHDRLGARLLRHAGAQGRLRLAAHDGLARAAFPGRDGGAFNSSGYALKMFRILASSTAVLVSLAALARLPGAQASRSLRPGQAGPQPAARTTKSATGQKTAGGDTGATTPHAGPATLDLA